MVGLWGKSVEIKTKKLSLSMLEPHRCVSRQPIRLQIMSSLVALDTGEQVDPVHLRKILDLTDGNLGAHLAKLEEAGYVKIEKTFIARKLRTFINVTGKGRDAFNEHLAALRQIIEASEKND